MAEAERVCWKCGASVADLPLPLSRYAECAACRTELHVCRMCQFYDSRVAKACREPVADEVRDKTRANFCGYFQMRSGAYQPKDTGKARAAGDDLAALFGESAAAEDSGETLSEAEAAQRRMEKLFRGDQ